jgi:hypothetical protein
MKQDSDTDNDEIDVNDSDKDSLDDWDSDDYDIYEGLHDYDVSTFGAVPKKLLQQGQRNEQPAPLEMHNETPGNFNVIQVRNEEERKRIRTSTPHIGGEKEAQKMRESEREEGTEKEKTEKAEQMKQPRKRKRKTAREKRQHKRMLEEQKTDLHPSWQAKKQLSETQAHATWSGVHVKFD